MCGGAAFLGVFMEGKWGIGVLFVGGDVPADECKQWKEKKKSKKSNKN